MFVLTMIANLYIRVDCNMCFPGLIARCSTRTNLCKKCSTSASEDHCQRLKPDCFIHMLTHASPSLRQLLVKGVG